MLAVVRLDCKVCRCSGLGYCDKVELTLCSEAHEEELNGLWQMRWYQTSGCIGALAKLEALRLVELDQWHEILGCSAKLLLCSWPSRTLM